MKIGELFVALGFDIKGRQGLIDVESGMKEAAGSAGKLTLGVAAVNTVMLAMVALSARAGAALKNFALETGESTVELQKWQHMAVVNDVTADQLTSTIEGLQDARSKFALGEPEAVGAWSLLGVNPTQDPFKVLGDLRTQLRTFQDTGVARNLAARVGIGNDVFRMLVASNEEFERWNANLAVLPAQTERLRRLDAAWKSLRFAVDQIRNQFAAAFVPVLTMVAKGLEKLAEWLAIVTQWLNGTSPVARVAATVLGWLAVALLAIGAALAVVTGAMGILLGLLTLFSPALIAVGLALAPIALDFLVIAAAVTGLILLIDDLWTAMKGGKSFFEWGPTKWLAKNLKTLWNGLPESPEQRARYAVNPADVTSFHDILSSIATGPGQRTSGGDATQNNDVRIYVSGDGDPVSTGRAVHRTLSDEIKGAAYQFPVRSW